MMQTKLLTASAVIIVLATFMYVDGLIRDSADLIQQAVKSRNTTIESSLKEDNVLQSEDAPSYKYRRIGMASETGYRLPSNSFQSSSLDPFLDPAGCNIPRCRFESAQL